MSSVRMCDRCGTVFSELTEGWQTFQAATFKRDEDGRRISVPTAMDACPACAITPDDSPAAVREQNDGFFARKRLETRNAELERELAAERERSARYADDAEPPAEDGELVTDPAARVLEETARVLEQPAPPAAAE